jgi:hypothetical protein
MIQLVNYEQKDRRLWDDYVSFNPNATCYHLSAWKRAVGRVYEHHSHYLIAQSTVGESGDAPEQSKIVGVLPFFI